MTKNNTEDTIAILKQCVEALEDKKAMSLKVLDMRGKSPITNFYIIATANSQPHMKALAGELEKTLKDLKIKTIGRDFTPNSGWLVLDAFDFMAHIFLESERGVYAIESLWKDAKTIDLEELKNS